MIRTLMYFELNFYLLLDKLSLSELLSCGSHVDLKENFM